MIHSRCMRFAVLSLPLVAILVAGCSYVQYPKTSKHDTTSPSFVDTSPGYHIISSHFAYRFEGNPEDSWTIGLYRLDKPDDTGSAALLGYVQLERPWWEPEKPYDPSYSRESFYAVSKDGESLVYLQGKEQKDGLLKKHLGAVDPRIREKPVGLYEYRLSSGDTLLIPLATSKYEYTNIDLAEDEIIFWLIGPDHHVLGLNDWFRGDQYFVYTRNGEVCPAIYLNGPELHRALAMQELGKARDLVKAGARTDAFDQKGWQPLHVALRYVVDPEMIRFLLENGADPNNRVKDTVVEEWVDLDETWSPLFCGVQFWHRRSHEVVRALLEYGADVNAPVTISARDTPINLAAEEGVPPSVLSVLLEYGADANNQGEAGDTPLHKWASHLQAPDDLQTGILLIDGGADVNARNDRGQTPLHVALNPDIVEFLLEHGADRDAEDNSGDKPPLDENAKRWRETREYVEKWETYSR